MANKKEVLYGLRHQIEDADWLEGQRKDNVPIWILRDAYNLLKEQEPKPVNNVVYGKTPMRLIDAIGECPFCGLKISKYYHPVYCGVCGRRITWDD